MKTASLTKDLSFNEKKPAITVLFETDASKEIRILMRKGQTMAEHKTPYPIVVELYDGSINFGVNGELLALQSGDVLALDGNVPHDLVATEDSIIRLTLTKQDTVFRVEGVIASTIGNS